MCAVCEHYCTSCTDLLQLYKDAQQLRERCNGRARKRTRRDYTAHYEFKYHEIHHKQDWHKLLLEIALVMLCFGRRARRNSCGTKLCVWRLRVCLFLDLALLGLLWFALRCFSLLCFGLAWQANLEEKEAFILSSCHSWFASPCLALLDLA